MNNTIKTTFRALQYRNFRLFFAGQSISLTGTWMQTIAMSWLVYRMTGSALLLGVVGFASQIPTFILSPFAGVLADRYNRHRIIILTQTLSMVQAFILAALTLTGVIVSLLLMKVKPRQIITERRHVLHELREGLVYAFGSASIRSILFLLSIISMTGMSYVVLMPIFAKEIHHGGAYTLGVLMATVGLGALIGTLYLASRKDHLKLERFISVSSAIFATGLIFFALSRVLWFSLLMLVVTGFGFMVTTASCNTVLQTNVDDDKRGRVMSLYTMAFMGMAPLGSLLAGALASKFGASDAVILGGLLCLFSTLIFSKKQKIFS